jgi:hypothetical protein
MTNESPGGRDMVSLDDLTELLAEAEGTTPEEIERAADEFDIAPPWQGTLVEEEPTLSFSDASGTNNGTERRADNRRRTRPC